MNSPSVFQPNQPPEKVDSELKSALKIKDAAHQCSLDWFGEIFNRKLYLELGFSSINQYARQELGFGNSKIGDCIKLTRKLEKLPNLKASMSKGEVGNTKGRMIVQVADETTEKAWEQIRKQGNASSEKVEALLEIMESFLDVSSQNASPRGENSRPSAQIHIHHCPECEASTIQTSKGELEIGKTEFERYQCDCQASTPDGRNTTSIPPATRRKVMAKARHRCQAPGCNHTRFLEIHHLVPRFKGGSNLASNLRVYCSACHSRIHAHGLGLMVKSPAAIYSWNENPRETHFTRYTLPVCECPPASNR
jgi:5-methylcytosine-specific restriction endonuclease McrA